MGATEATLFAKSSPSEPVPDLQFQSTNFSTEHLTLGLDRWPGFGFNFCVCRPKSRGEIKLADGTRRSKPRIFANYFSDAEDDDMRRSLAAFHMGRQIIATEPYRSLIFCEVRPGAHVIADEDIRAFIRQVAGTVYHPCGTCRMGQDQTAVVDSELKVHGLTGLRVVDASGDAGDPLAQHPPGHHHDCRKGLRQHRPIAGGLRRRSARGARFLSRAPKRGLAPEPAKPASDLQPFVAHLMVGLEIGRVPSKTMRPCPMT